MTSAAAAVAARFPLMRLLDYERRVAENVLFRSSSTWRERARWVLVPPLLIVFGHLWLSDMPIANATRSASGMAGFLALSITRASARRSRFHRSDGLMAAEALVKGVGPRFQVLYVGAALLGLELVLALLDPRLLPACTAAMALGVLAGLLMNLATSFEAIRRAWTLFLRIAGAWLRRPVAGLALAAAFGLIAWPITRFSPDDAAIMTAGSLAFGCSFFLTPIDAAAVRFMAQSGIGTALTLRTYGWGIGAFVPPATGIAFALLGMEGAAVTLGASAAAILIMCLRILTYRLYDKWLAELIVITIIAALGIAGTAFAPALPVLAAAIVWTLWRRAQASAWLLAL